MMRILHVIPQLSRGGAERQLVQLLPRMDRARFEQAVVYYSPAPDVQDDELLAAGIPVFYLNKFSNPLWRFALWLRGVIREFRPDIVHTWLYSARFWGRILAMSCGVRRLLASTRSVMCDVPWPVRVYERLLAGRTIHLANSRAIAQSMEQWAGVPVDDVRIIYNAVSVPERDQASARVDIRTELGLPESQQIVLMVGRHAVEKNYPMFIRAGAALTRKRSNVTFVGLGRFVLEAELRAVIREEHAEENVRLVQMQPDVFRWMAGADVFCLTSDREGFPNVVLEAMASALPVVCTDFPAVQEIEGIADSAVLVPRNDAAALARVVEELLDDPDRRAAMGRAGKLSVQGAYSWPALVDKMETLYEEVYALPRMGRTSTGGGRRA